MNALPSADGQVQVVVPVKVERAAANGNRQMSRIESPVLPVPSSPNSAPMTTSPFPNTAPARQGWRDEVLSTLVSLINQFILASNKQFSFESPPSTRDAEDNEKEGEIGQKRKRKCRHNVAYMTWEDLVALSARLGFQPKQIVNKYNNTCNQAWAEAALDELNLLLAALGYAGKTPEDISWEQWAQIGNAMTPPRFAGACMRGLRQQFPKPEETSPTPPTASEELSINAAAIVIANLAADPVRKKPRTLRSNHVKATASATPVMLDQEDIEFGLGGGVIPARFVKNTAVPPPFQILSMPRQFSGDRQVSLGALSYRTSISTASSGPSAISVIITPARMDQLLQDYCTLVRKLIDECAPVERVYDAARRCVCAVSAWEVDCADQRDHVLQSFDHYFSYYSDKVFGADVSLSTAEQAHILTCRALYRKCINNICPRVCAGLNDTSVTPENNHASSL